MRFIVKAVSFIKASTEQYRSFIFSAKKITELRIALFPFFFVFKCVFLRHNFFNKT